MLEALEEAPEGLSTRELEATVNLGNAGIGKTIELLSLESPESPTPLAKLDGRWQLTAAPLHDRPRPSAQGRAGSADRRAEDASLRLHDRLAGRFDEAMDRIAGWYMRRVALLIFAIAAAVTVAPTPAPAPSTSPQSCGATPRWAPPSQRKRAPPPSTRLPCRWTPWRTWARCPSAGTRRPEPATGQGAQELQPEPLGLGRPTRGAKHLSAALGVDPHGDHPCPIYHVAILARLLRYVASSHRYGHCPLSGRSRNLPTRWSMSWHSRDTWLLEIPLIPIACHQVVHLAGADPLHVRLLDHRASACSELLRRSRNDGK